jgi:hypothetical protein
MRHVPSGHIEQLPSGAWRAKVYAGTDPLTGREIRFRKTRRTEVEAQIELGKLLELARAGRSPDSGVTVAELLDAYVPPATGNWNPAAAPAAAAWASSARNASIVSASPSCSMTQPPVPTGAGHRIPPLRPPASGHDQLTHSRPVPGHHPAGLIRSFMAG